MRCSASASPRTRLPWEVYDEKQIPADYFISPPALPPKLDKTLIAQALKDNHDVPGAPAARAWAGHPLISLAAPPPTEKSQAPPALLLT